MAEPARTSPASIVKRKRPARGKRDGLRVVIDHLAPSSISHFRLQVFAWRSPRCCLPDDDVRLARMLGTTPKRWANLKPIVLANWTLIEGNWRNDQVAREHQFVSEKVERKRAAGKLGVRLKSLELQDAGEALGSEIEKQTESETKAAKATYTHIVPTGNEHEGFLKFKAVYPKRNVAFSTTLARKRWLEACRRGASPDEIIAGATAYAAEQSRIGKVGTEFVKTADAWLNQQRWRDYTAAPVKLAAAAPASVADDSWRDQVQRWQDTRGYCPWRDSEAPNSPKTLVPAAILEKFGIGRYDENPAMPKLSGAR
jgi:uncharacterized protein YdaU (DUF1376 family)